jgi:hypothetical protein
MIRADPWRDDPEIPSDYEAENEEGLLVASIFL